MNQDAVYAGLSGAAAATALVALAAGLTGAAPETHAFWYLSRTSGLVAYALLWLSVMAGLLLSGRTGRGLVPPKVALEVHQTSSGLALAFAFFHGLILTGDRFLGLGLVELLVPLSGSLQPLWLAGGQLAFCLLAAVLATSLMRRRLGNPLWRRLHYLAFLGYWMSLAHALVMGSDTGRPLIALFYLATGALAFWLTLARVFLREGAGGG